MGLAREVVNKVQMLRKSTGLSIDDQIEVFFQLQGDDTIFREAISKNIAQIKSSVKMPFLDAVHRQGHQVVVAETEYVNPQNEKDTVKVIICVPNVAFVDEKLHEKYGAHNTDKVSFTSDVKSFVLSYSKAGLRHEVESQQGTLRFTLNGQKVEVTHGVDFFYSAQELADSKQ